MATQTFRQYEPYINDTISIVLASRRGVDAMAFSDLADLSGYRREEVARLFDTLLRTLTRYRDNHQTISLLLGELTLKMLALFRHGEEVFGNLAEFRRGLNTPPYKLGNQISFSLLQTLGGIDLINDELSRTEFGATV